MGDYLALTEERQGHRPVPGEYDPIPAALERPGRVPHEVNSNADSEFDLRGSIFDMRLGLTLTLCLVRISKAKKYVLQLGEPICLHHNHPQLFLFLEKMVYARLEAG